MADIAKWCDYNLSALSAVYWKYHEQFGEFSGQYHRIHSYIAATICVVGVLANLAIIIVLLQPAMRRSSVNALLTAIAAFDMSLMAAQFVYGMIDPVCHEISYKYYWILFTVFYANYSVVAHTASLWLTVNMAALRYMIIRKPRRVTRQLDTAGASRRVILTTLLIVCACSSLNFLRNQIGDFGEQPIPPSNCINSNHTIVHVYNIERPPWWNCRLEKANFWFAGIMFKIVPCIMLTVFMALLVHMLFKARKRRQRLEGNNPQRSTRTNRLRTDRTTIMLVLIVFVFLVTELPQGVLVLATAADPSVMFLYRFFGDILDLLSLINSSVNFILYCSMSAQFRTNFMATFCRKCQSTELPTINYEMTTTAVERSNRRLTAKHSLATNTSLKEILMNKDSEQSNGMLNTNAA